LSLRTHDSACGNLYIIKDLWDCFGRFTPSQRHYDTVSFAGVPCRNDKWDKACRLFGFYNLRLTTNAWGLVYIVRIISDIIVL